MKRKNPAIFSLLSQGMILVATFLLSVGLVSAKPLQSESPTMTLAQADNRQQEEVEELLDELQKERQVQEQVQAEANRAFSRTTTWFNVLLAILALLLAATIVALWILRRAVIREVTEIVKTHLEELGGLESQLASAKQEVSNISAKS